MKKRMLALLCALALLPAAACAKQESVVPEGAYQVYFAVDGETAAARSVEFEYRVPPAGEEAVPGLVKLLLAGPETMGLATPFLPGVELNSFALEEDGVLRLDLSEQYNGLPGVYLTVANACLVLTLSQVEGVEAVSITVEGEPLPYQTVQFLRASDLVLSGAEEEAVSVSAALYFPRREGDGLSAEYRTVVKTEADSLPAAVLLALLEGPRNEELTPALPQGTLIRSVRTENGICKVDLSQEFLHGAGQGLQSARLTVYSVVNTLCALAELDIQSVQLYVEGQPIESYGGLPAAAPLEADDSLAK